MQVEKLNPETEPLLGFNKLLVRVLLSATLPVVPYRLPFILLLKKTLFLFSVKTMTIL